MYQYPRIGSANAQDKLFNGALGYTRYCSARVCRRFQSRVWLPSALLIFWDTKYTTSLLGHILLVFLCLPCLLSFYSTPLVRDIHAHAKLFNTPTSDAKLLVRKVTYGKLC